MGAKATPNAEPVIEPVECNCYKCAGAIHKWTPRGRIVVNNVHGHLQACESCGRPKTEYVDLGRKGVYRCWWCEDRTANHGEL